MLRCAACPFAFSCALVLMVAPLSVSADDRVDFVRDIKPLFEDRCTFCHGDSDQEGRLRLDAKAIVMQGGISGPAVVPGKPEKSLIYKRVAGIGDGDQMPLDDDPLTEEEIDLIRRWIEQGAKWPDGVGSDVKSLKTHWAYVPPKQPMLPAVKNADWVQSPIDAFVLARLEKEGLAPSPRADRARLCRRVYLDLIGLPPTPEEVDAFVNDSRPGAYERLVDRLLASPRYGERWARPWLDLARYADSNGYQADQYRSVWPYRDWVIRAMNADMPFSQFTIEQVAGDLLPNATVDQRVATGFHRLTTCNVEAGVDPEENRVNQVIDRVNTTGTVWLGSTIECAQCHNHKYDPFTQRDFYGLFAFFNNTPLEVEGDGVTYNFVGPTMDLPLTGPQAGEREKLRARTDELKAELDKRLADLAKSQADWERGLAKAAKESPQWHVLPIDSFKSQGGASHTILDDHSVLVGGAKPDTDVYTIAVRTELSGITGFKIETLTDDSLPGKGPGRHHPERPNFVLHEFTVTASECSEAAKSEAVSLHSAAADYSQPQYKVDGAIDGDPKTAWAIHPEFHKPHYATFLTVKPVGFEAGTLLTFVLDQHHGEGRTIGRLRISAMTGTPNKSALPDPIAKILALDPAKRNKKQNQQLTDYYVELDAAVKQFRQQIAALEKKIAAIQPTTTLVMIEDNARDTHIFRRGNFLDKSEPVDASTPRILPQQSSDAPPDRLALASWLVDDNNPLTARVAVNRWWAEFFGRGIVETIEDFGTQGEPPTHPELLDWLACQLMTAPSAPLTKGATGGWSMKEIHRQIVLSATYQQSSVITPKLKKLDPYNKLYARGPRFRLSAETIRDNALAIAGLLTDKMGGPPVYPPQPDDIWRHVGRNAPKYDTDQDEDRFRRGLYVIWRRSAPYPSFTNFDAPDRASCVANRPKTNTPLQALTLLNDPAYVEMAQALAERIAGDHSELTIDEKVAYGFRLCVAREPTDKELEHVVGVYQRELARLQADPKAANALIGKTHGKVAPAELAAWFYVANILLNLDETITKG